MVEARFLKVKGEVPKEKEAGFIKVLDASKSALIVDPMPTATSTPYRPESAQDRAIRATLDARRVALYYEEDATAAELLAHLAGLGVDEAGDPLSPPEPDYAAEVEQASRVATAAAPDGGAAWGVAFGAEMDRLAGPRCEARVTGWIREYAQCGRVLQ